MSGCRHPAEKVTSYCGPDGQPLCSVRKDTSSHQSCTQWLVRPSSLPGDGFLFYFLKSTPSSHYGDWEVLHFQAVACYTLGGNKKSQTELDGFPTGACWDELSWRHAPCCAPGTPQHPEHPHQPHTPAELPVPTPAPGTNTGPVHPHQPRAPTPAPCTHASPRAGGHWSRGCMSSSSQRPRVTSDEAVPHRVEITNLLQLSTLP